MAKWYENEKLETYIANYENEKQFRNELKKATEHGWEVKHVTGIPGHTNIGVVVMSVGLFGRTKDKIIVHYERTNSWLKAKRERELARRMKMPWWHAK